MDLLKFLLFLGIGRARDYEEHSCVCDTLLLQPEQPGKKERERGREREREGGGREREREGGRGGGGEGES